MREAACSATRVDTYMCMYASRPVSMAAPTTLRLCDATYLAAETHVNFLGVSTNSSVVQTIAATPLTAPRPS